VVLVDGGRFLERAWHEVYFDQEKTPVFGHIGCYFVIGKKRPKNWFSNSFLKVSQQSVWDASASLRRHRRNRTA